MKDAATSPETGFAILGAGAAAKYHREAIEASAGSGSRLVAVGHHDPSRFDELGRRFGAPCWSFEELLDQPEVDVVCLCTPSGQHAEQAVAAARAGKHVLVEKPMALDLAGADAMISACDENDVRLGVVLQRRAEPLFARVREAIRSGDLGELTLGTVVVPYHRSQDYYDGAGWRGTWALDGGGVLMNQGIHLVDLLVWYMGDPVEFEACASTLHRNIEAEDTLTANLRFSNGALATITATTTTAPGFPHRVEVYGTRGGIQIEGESAARWELADPAEAAVVPSEASASDGSGAGGDPGGISAAGHVAIFEDFIEALAGDRDPAVSGKEGRRSVRAVREIYRAAGLLSAVRG